MLNKIREWEDIFLLRLDTPLPFFVWGLTCPKRRCFPKLRFQSWDSQRIVLLIFFLSRKKQQCYEILLGVRSPVCLHDRPHDSSVVSSPLFLAQVQHKKHAIVDGGALRAIWPKLPLKILTLTLDLTICIDAVGSRPLQCKEVWGITRCSLARYWKLFCPCCYRRSFFFSWMSANRIMTELAETGSYCVTHFRCLSPRRLELSTPGAPWEEWRST